MGAAVRAALRGQLAVCTHPRSACQFVTLLTPLVSLVTLAGHTHSQAKEYGIIDHIIGGEDAVFNIKGSTRKFPKVGVTACVAAVCDGLVDNGCYSCGCAHHRHCRPRWHAGVHVGAPLIASAGMAKSRTTATRAALLLSPSPPDLTPHSSLLPRSCFNTHLTPTAVLWPHQVKDEFVTDREDMAKRNIMDGDPFLASSPSWRFRAPETEPYMPAQAPGACAGCTRHGCCSDQTLFST